MTGPGLLVHIFVAERAGAPMRELRSARCIAGVGVEGDRYATGRGHYSDRPRPDRQITLIQLEVLDWLHREHALELTPQACRRNLVTRDIALDSFVGRTLAVGGVLLRVGRLNEPCRYLEELVDLPVLEPLVHRSGINCEIIQGGWIRTGDEVRPVSVAEE
jgi:MOSC domain-containing protein YiiM